MQVQNLDQLKLMEDFLQVVIKNFGCERDFPNISFWKCNQPMKYEPINKNFTPGSSVVQALLNGQDALRQVEEAAR